jgi:cytochrome P450
VLEVLSHSDRFSARTYYAAFNDSVGSSMLGNDNAMPNLVEKPEMRTLLTRDDFPRIRQQVAELTAAAIARAAIVTVDPKTGQRHARVDIVAPVARLVPIQLTGTYFGFPGPDEATMSRWSRAIQGDLRNLVGEKAVHAEAVKAGEEMRAYLTGLVRERRAAIAKSPGSDDTILGRMLKLDRGSPDKPVFSDERAVVTIAGMLIGAVETTQDCVVQALAELFSRPEQFAGALQAARANDDAQLSRYVWEALRFRPPSPILPRYAEHDTVLAAGTDHETTIKQGSLVIASTHSAMFDEAAVRTPMEFRDDRPMDVYLHLGYGDHRCLGDYVSLIQVPQIVKTLLLKKNLREASGSGGSFIYHPMNCPRNYILEFEPDSGG